MHAITTDEAIQLTPSFALAANKAFDYAQLAYFESPPDPAVSKESTRAKTKKERRASSAERICDRAARREDFAKPGSGVVRRHIAGLAKQALRRK